MDAKTCLSCATENVINETSMELARLVLSKRDTNWILSKLQSLAARESVQSSMSAHCSSLFQAASGMHSPDTKQCCSITSARDGLAAEEANQSLELPVAVL